MSTEGAVLRVRPKAMTVAVLLGLVPVFIDAGAGSEVVRRIAAPLLGRMNTAPLRSMLIVPAA